LLADRDAVSSCHAVTALLATLPTALTADVAARRGTMRNSLFEEC
jgi:hypothetical protein